MGGRKAREEQRGLTFFMDDRLDGLGTRTVRRWPADAFQESKGVTLEHAHTLTHTHPGQGELLPGPHSLCKCRSQLLGCPRMGGDSNCSYESLFLLLR